MSKGTAQNDSVPQHVRTRATPVDPLRFYQPRGGEQWTSLEDLWELSSALRQNSMAVRAAALEIRTMSRDLKHRPRQWPERMGKQALARAHASAGQPLHGNPDIPRR